MVPYPTRAVAALAAALMTSTTAVVALGTAPDSAAVVPAPGSTAPTATTETQARRAVAGMPLAFEANRGQTERRVRYLARGDGFTLFLTRREAVFGLRGAAVALRPVGATRKPRLVGLARQAATTSYFRGKDPSTWQRGVPTYARVRYQGLYRHVDMVVRGDRSGAEYDFVVAPGADPSRIGYRLEGAEHLRLRGGDLVARTAAGDFVHHAPVAYQRVDGHRQRVDARFRLRHGVVSFVVGSYDTARPLVIDPETDLDYSTYVGADAGAVAVVVRGGDAYISGTTYGADFPTTTGAYDTTASVSDAFVSRISLDGSGAADLVYSTVIGGGYYDFGTDLAVEGDDVYLTGSTESGDFPTTDGAFDTDFYGSDGGGTDTFFAKISPDGAGTADLVYSTYLGGNYYSSGRASIAVHDGDAWLAGGTDGGPYPTTPGAMDHGDGSEDIWLARISPDGAGTADLKYGAVFGGAGDERANDIAFSRGDLYLTGGAYYELTKKEFPTTRGAYDRTSNGETDVFVARVSPDGKGRADLRYATLLGTSRPDSAAALAVRDGLVYLAASTTSRHFPTTKGAYDRSYGGKGDAVVAIIATKRRVRHDLKYSTYFGAGAQDFCSAIRVSAGEVYLAGSTESPGLPTTANAYDRTHNGKFDGFVAMLALDGARRRDLDYSTFLGGPQDDSATALAIDSGAAYVTGSAGTGFPTTPGAYDTTYNQGGGAYLTRLLLPAPG